jgi:hypothetical protein
MTIEDRTSRKEQEGTTILPKMEFSQNPYEKNGKKIEMSQIFFQTF